MNLYRLLRHVPAANVAALVLALVACAALAAEPSTTWRLLRPPR